MSKYLVTQSLFIHLCHLYWRTIRCSPLPHYWFRVWNLGGYHFRWGISVWPLFNLITIAEFVRYQVRANETYSEAKRQFSVRNRYVLMNVQSPHKWWSTLKTAVFGSSSSLPPLVREGGGLVCESVRKFPGVLETGQCHPNSERSTVLFCCQLPTSLHNISIV